MKSLSAYFYIFLIDYKSSSSRSFRLEIPTSASFFGVRILNHFQAKPLLEVGLKGAKNLHNGDAYKLSIIVWWRCWEKAKTGVESLKSRETAANFKRAN